MAPPTDYRRACWDHFCDRYDVVRKCVPLLSTAIDGSVLTRLIGLKRPRQVLARSPEMEKLVIRETTTLVDDWERGNGGTDGLIYMMLRKVDGDFSPLYIGKAETVGRNGVLSANLHGLDRDRGKFARWGDNYAYHIGDLSAWVLPGHDATKQHAKYRRWAESLFAEFPSSAPRLRFPVYFWAKAWRPSDIGIWPEFGPTSVTFLEYLLIGVASSLWPEILLNAEGQNRQ